MIQINSHKLKSTLTLFYLGDCKPQNFFFFLLENFDRSFFFRFFSIIFLLFYKMAFSGTLQKCKACDKTVYVVDLLSADGVPYHKSCFKCSHCKGQLVVHDFIHFKHPCGAQYRAHLEMTPFGFERSRWALLLDKVSCPLNYSNLSNGGPKDLNALLNFFLCAFNSMMGPI